MKVVQGIARPARGDGLPLHRGARGFLIALLAGASGCTTEPPVPIVIDDNDASARMVRIAWRPDSSEAGRKEGGLDIEYAQHRGASDQVLNSGQRMVLGASVATGPQMMRHQAETRYAHVAYSHVIPVLEGVFPAGTLEFDVLVGLARYRYGISSQGDAPATPLLARGVYSTGVMLGYGPRWNFTERTALEARVTKTVDDPIGALFSDAKDRSGFDIALVLRPVRQVSLRAGYSRVRIETPEVYGESNISMDLRGPYLGLALQF